MAATGKQMPLFTGSPLCECVMMKGPKLMLCGERQKAKPVAKSYAASNDTSSAKHTELSTPHRPRFLPLDKHRSINALAESTIGLFKTEVICFMGPWKSVGQVEWETLNWVNWYNTKRLHSTIGYITPQEAEENFYEALNAAEKAA